MNIRTLETFIWIAKLGSFRAAASRVFASQPTVSARIAGLEDQLGVELFNRSSKKVTLTAIRSLVDPMNHSTRIHASSSLSTIIRMTVDGLGISALPWEILQHELSTGTLRQLVVNAEVPDLVFSASYRAAAGGHVVQAIAELALSIAEARAPAPKNHSAHTDNTH
jgi:DNA-binding transcriptional LysR family regulator